jgi:prepilin-type N-terminal cleavage/methylation domain-containing protein
MKYKKRVNKGFTLLEILLVIATIGILAAIVLVAINPNRQLAQVRNAQRRSDINTIYKALEQYLIDTGNYPNSVNSNFKEICNTGTEQVGGATDCSGKADLRSLVPTYLAAIPTASNGGIYRVGINSNNKIAVYIVGESNQLIDINFNDIDANNYITAIELADGQALELEVKIAITTFIIGLKTDNIWESIKASVIMAGARTLNGALVPLKGSTPTNSNFVAGDYNRKTGLVGDGSTKSLNSNRNNNADPQNSKHLAVWRSTAATNNNHLLGSGNGAGDSDLYTGFGSFITRNNASTAVFESLSTHPGSIFYGTSRAGSSQFTTRIGGATYTANVTSETPSNRNIFVFQSAFNNSWTNARLAFYSIGESLDLALLDARVSQFMIDLGNAIP